LAYPESLRGESSTLIIVARRWQNGECFIRLAFKRRMKEYNLMKKPRPQLRKALLHKKVAA
jgi:hypothetical protein